MQIKWAFINQADLSDILENRNSGIYAWYYKVKVSNFDCEQLIKELEDNIEYSNKKMRVKQFLVKNIFSYFKHPEVESRISGPLMPSFKGKLDYEIDITDSLVEKVVENPYVIYGIKESIENIAPEFSSPLYVGMASDLKRRILQHKNLITAIKESKTKIFGDEIPVEDKNFAERVVGREFVLNNLFVTVSCISDRDGLHNIMENIINRINYPILGRN